MSIFCKKEKSAPPVSVSPTPQREDDQWLAYLTRKLHERGLPLQTEIPSSDDRNTAAIQQSVRQHVEIPTDKK